MSNQQLGQRSMTAAGSAVGRASGFELVDRSRPDRSEPAVDSALARNRAVRRRRRASRRRRVPQAPPVRDHVPRSMRVDPAYVLGTGPQRRDGHPQRGWSGHPGGDQRRRLHRPTGRERAARRPAVRGRRDPPHPMRGRRARRRRLPPPLRRADRRRGVDPTRARRPRPHLREPQSHAMSSACGPHPPSPRASPCPGTSTTSSPASSTRSSPPAAAQTETSSDPILYEATRHHDHRSC